MILMIQKKCDCLIAALIPEADDGKGKNQVRGNLCIRK